MKRNKKCILIAFVTVPILCSCGLAACPSADLSGDCFVDYKDFALMAEQWLTAGRRIEIEDFETGDFSKYDWQHSGAAPWVIVSDTFYEGSYAAKSGAITHSQTSTLEIAFDTPFELISFYRRVSSENNYDFLRFYIDGVLLGSWSGNQDWAQQTYSITPGLHTFRWSYTKDDSFDVGFDCAWIDNIMLFNYCKVPDVTGMSQVDAEAAIIGAGLVVGSISEVFSGLVPEGHVISQAPLGGETVLSGSTVNLVVSGAKSVVPDVAGMAQMDAEAAIINAFLVVGTISEAFSDTVPEGHVISQAPLGGETVLSGSTVNIVVSGVKGIVPDVTGMAQVDAEAVIIEADLVVGTISEAYSDTVPEGHVISQAPLCGESVLSGSTVDMVVSVGTPPEVAFVYINDPGVPEHEPFTGLMSKYETTNAQFAQYLNTAKASGDIVVSGDYVKGATGSNIGGDFVGQDYYYLAGQGLTDHGATNGGAARIKYSDGSFTVDSGFENHPVSYVSWYGATAFCDYYGWWLPTKWEWQAVADYDGSYIYACGPTINVTIANYKYSTHPDGTTIVGTFGPYGYGMCDMTGNVHEWSSGSVYPTSESYAICGGGWYSPEQGCTASPPTSRPPRYMLNDLGFRVCR